MTNITLPSSWTTTGHVEQAFEKLDELPAASDVETSVKNTSLFLEQYEPPASFPAFPLSVIAHKIGAIYNANISASDVIDFQADFARYMYADSARPDNSGDGLTWATAKKSAGACADSAIEEGISSIVMIKTGVLSRFEGLMNVGTTKNLTCNLALVAVGGRVTTGPFETLSWSRATTLGEWGTLTGAHDEGERVTHNGSVWLIASDIADIVASEPSGVNSDYIEIDAEAYSKIYQTSRSNAQRVMNPQMKNPNGSDVQYTFVDNISECTKPNTWYTDNQYVWVHTINDAQADDLNARVFLSARNLDVSGDYKVYCYGIDFVGGSQGAMKYTDVTVVAEECTFKYALYNTITAGWGAVDGVVGLGGLFVGIKSEASFNSKDGFNFHASGVGAGNSLTVGCSGFENGHDIPSTASCNGLTNHDGGLSIDIGGRYTGSLGANVAIVNDDTEMWCFGTVAGNSAGDYDTISTGGFSAGEGSVLHMEHTRDVGVAIAINAGGPVNIRNHAGCGRQLGSISVLTRG